MHWILEHPYKQWYGHPTQVWTTVESPTEHFIPVNKIKSRTVYVKCTQDFGQQLLGDTVFVVVPLLSF